MRAVTALSGGLIVLLPCLHVFLARIFKVGPIRRSIWNEENDDEFTLDPIPPPQREVAIHNADIPLSCCRVGKSYQQVCDPPLDPTGNTYNPSYVSGPMKNMDGKGYGRARPLRIAIVGGGIGGLFAALSIHHHCQDLAKIDVYEQAPEFKEIGAGLGLGINAARLVHKIGLGDEMNKVAGRRNGVWISFRRFDNSQEIYTIRANDKQEVRQCPLARSDLLDILRQRAIDTKAATLHTGKRLVGIQEDRDAVALRFEDSTSPEAHLVVGADGIHSQLRSQFAVDNPIYSGRVAYRATVSTSGIQDWWPFDTCSIMWNGKGRHFLVFPISSNRTLNIVAFANTRPEGAKGIAESWVSTCSRREVEEAFQGFDEPVKRLIALMPDEPSRWKINDRVPLDQWSFLGGKVVLLGDAAHAMLPHMGAGAGQAIEDGWILGKALGDLVNGTADSLVGDLDTSAALYQKVRLPRAQKIQQKSRDTGDTYDLKTAEMKDKPFEDCLPLLADTPSRQMKFV